MDNILLTNIQRGSLHDGPGVRITYFFQGCNLRCGWCHNPETLTAQPKLLKYADKCIGCGLCATVCPQGGQADCCVNCGACSGVCPTGARVMSGKAYTAEELLEIARHEAGFIAKGGITCSGGEPMLQIDALENLLRLFHEQRIHTAVDSAANVPWEWFERVMPYTDLFLIDYKLSDNDSHKKYTGVPRELIAANLKKLSESAKEVWIRMPIIPGVNDNTDHIDAAGRELAEMGFGGLIELLPFHRLGSAKYKALGLQYAFEDTQPPSQEKMALLRTRLATFGLNVKR